MFLVFLVRKLARVRHLKSLEFIRVHFVILSCLLILSTTHLKMTQSDRRIRETGKVANTTHKKLHKVNIH